MRGTQRITALTMYRAEVAWLMEQGERFGAVEDGIEEIPDLSQDEKAALWLYAFSLRTPRDQERDERDTRAHLAAVE